MIDQAFFQVLALLWSKKKKKNKIKHAQLDTHKNLILYLQKTKIHSKTEYPGKAGFKYLKCILY